jgi:hypothetical protein
MTTNMKEAKEIAEELMKRFNFQNNEGIYSMTREQVQQCAIEHVDLLLKHTPMYTGLYNPTYGLYKNVRYCLENILIQDKPF